MMMMMTSDVGWRGLWQCDIDYRK